MAKVGEDLSCTGDNSYNQLNIPTVWRQYTTRLVAGEYHTCAMFYRNNVNRKQNVFKCWGNDGYGQLKIPQGLLDKLKAHPLDMLVAGAYITCATVKEKDGYVWCWGNNEFQVYDEQNQLFIGKVNNVQISIGNHCNICATYQHYLSTERTLMCWGKCPGNLCSIEPSYKLNNSSVEVGYNHACTMLNLGFTAELKCWGEDNYGQLRVPKDFVHWTASYSVGVNSSCAVKHNLHIACWGETEMPQIIKYFGRRVSAGGRHSCAGLGGTLFCFGNNEYDQTNVPATHYQDSVTVAAGWDYTCSLNISHQLECWGLNWLGQVEVPPLLSLKEISVSEVAVGLYHSCVRYQDPVGPNNIACWGGYNEFGELDVPRDLLNAILLIAVGDQHSCYFYKKKRSYTIRGHAGVLCTGNNFYGQIEVPVNVILNNVNRMVAGDAHTCLTKTDQRAVMCWGNDSHGQSSVPSEMLPNTYNNNTISPLSLAHLNAGTVHTCVIKWYAYEEKAELICWGLNLYHDHNNIDLRSNPYYIATGWMHDCAIYENGRIKCYGDNEYGQCNLPTIYI